MDLFERVRGKLTYMLASVLLYGALTVRTIQPTAAEANTTVTPQQQRYTA